jgi:hypothetical protein
MAASQRKLGKVLVRIVLGGVAGFALMKYGLGDRLGQLLRAAGAGPGAVSLAGFGLVFALMGAFVGLGAAVPALGARVLNVGSREDIYDQRAMLLGSAVSCTVLGIGMTLLALASPAGPVPSGLALSAFVFALVLTAAIAVLQWPRYDELWRSLTIEGTAFGGGMLAITLLVWSALAATGNAVLPDAAGLIALTMGLTLLGCFAAIGRRGMLVQE